MKTSNLKPSDKLNLQKIREDEKEILENSFITEFIYALPYVTAILNSERRIILSNKITIEEEEQEISVEEFFGHQPGAMLNCVHANRDDGTCDTDGICKYCGIPNAIFRSEKSEKKESQETSISLKVKNQIKTYDIRVTAAPFHYNNKRYTLLTVTDISESKRKRALERIFFHDVLNKTASLTGAFQLLNDQKQINEEEKIELLKLSDEIINDLNEEILLQKNLMDAEGGDLEIKISSLNTIKMLEESIKQIRQYPESENKNIKIDDCSVDEEIYSDPVLLKRIIINMLKNAVEASGDQDTIKAGCLSEQNSIKIWVNNPGYIPYSIQIQIFERTFSTKDKNRGLGSYSMKLLGEQYLNGKVDFVSSKDKGTTFYIKLPKE